MYYEVKSKISSTLVQLIVNCFLFKQNEQQLNSINLKKREEKFEQFELILLVIFFSSVKIGIFKSNLLPFLHPSCFRCWTIPHHILKKYTI